MWSKSVSHWVDGFQERPFHFQRHFNYNDKRDEKSEGAWRIYLKTLYSSNSSSTIYGEDGGVDVHDQLRLQSYSVQMTIKFRKWYKQVFLGLIDMVLVNMFIIWRLKARRDGKKEPRHYEFLEDLAISLINITDEELEDVRRSRRYPRARATALKTQKKIRIWTYVDSNRNIRWKGRSTSKELSHLLPERCNTSSHYISLLWLRHCYL